jgi:hypothetical protein
MVENAHAPGLLAGIEGVLEALVADVADHLNAAEREMVKKHFV